MPTRLRRCVGIADEWIIQLLDLFPQILAQICCIDQSYHELSDSRVANDS
jgi:hypothetical protein